MSHIVKLGAAERHAATWVASENAHGDATAYLVGSRFFGDGGKLVIIILTLGTMRLCLHWLLLPFDNWVPLELLSFHFKLLF